MSKRLKELKGAMPEFNVTHTEGILFNATKLNKSGKKINIPILWPRNIPAEQIAAETRESWKGINA